MKTVSPHSSIHIGPLRLLELWTSGFNFATIDAARKIFSQLKHGDVRLIDGVVFKKQHNDVVVVAVQRKKHRKKERLLLFTLVDMVSRGKTALEISTYNKDS